MSKQNPKGVLVTGGAGYIGSHAVLHLKEAGYEVVVLDNFSRGHEDLLKRLDVPYVQGNIDDAQALQKANALLNPSVVMHFAAFCYVGESVNDPYSYYMNNVVSTLGMLNNLNQLGLKRVIFSSTCATYGIPKNLPITEETPQAPINPYGHTKLMMEQILRDFETAYGFKSIFFRYFNASGASSSALIGERHDPETHIIPLAIYAAMVGPHLTVFGDDYPTEDGTCVRDYVHVSDIAKAHILGLEHLLRTEKSDVFNIGTGSGFSVAEVIKTVEQVSSAKVPFKMGPRREGDPPRLVANSQKIRDVLGWKPEFASLEQIVESAWRWHQKDTKIL